MEASVAEQSGSIIDELRQNARNMTGWLKFLGIINIISGAFSALSIIGIVFAWLPIWLGVLLIQASGKATEASIESNGRELVPMMEKLRLYFVIQGVIMLIFIGLAIIGIFSFIAMMPAILDTMQEYGV
jgi:hypothetical protein